MLSSRSRADWIRPFTTNSPGGLGCSEFAVHWISAVDWEVADPEVRDRPQALESLKRIRLEMVKRGDLTAMVCIGGMEGVLEEAKLFHEQQPGLPIFALESTGGSAEQLASNFEESWAVRVPERGVKNRVEKFWAEQRMREEHSISAHEGSERFAFPYAYIAQKIVAAIVDPDELDRPFGALG